jgi:hypothetical protein
MRQELNDTALAFDGETGPDLTGRDGSPILRDPYAHSSISLIQIPIVRAGEVMLPRFGRFRLDAIVSG